LINLFDIVAYWQEIDPAAAELHSVEKTKAFA
jgi:hypothetical protein